MHIFQHFPDEQVRSMAAFDIPADLKISRIAPIRDGQLTNTGDGSTIGVSQQKVEEKLTSNLQLAHGFESSFLREFGGVFEVLVRD